MLHVWLIEAIAIFAYLAANARRLDDIAILSKKVVHVALLVDSHECHFRSAAIIRGRDNGGAALDGSAIRIKVRNIPLCVWNWN